LIQATDSELFFLSAEIDPSRLRINMSPALGRIREVLDSTTDDRPVNQSEDFSSAIDQLSKAADLLDRGLLTREEFQKLKSGLIPSDQ
jgi:hypothetical protein